MKIYIPSMGRAHLVNSGTTAVWPEGVKATYVVLPKEMSEYEFSLRSKKDYIDVIPCDIIGMAEKRLWIGKHAKSCRAKKFLMLDDDLTICFRRDMTSAKLIQANALLVEQMLTTIDYLLHDDIAAAGISARQGNNHVSEAVVSNTRMTGVLGFQTEAFLSCEHSRVHVMEDFDIVLQLLCKGYENKVLYSYAWNQSGTQSIGGCSTYRTQEVQTESARRLKELHTDFVTLIQKKNKTGGDFGHRTDVRIAWKKAYKSGQEEAT